MESDTFLQRGDTGYAIHTTRNIPYLEVVVHHKSDIKGFVCAVLRERKKEQQVG